MDNNFEKLRNLPRDWDKLSYDSNIRVPASVEPNTSSWPTYYLKRSSTGNFLDQQERPISFGIKEPDSSIDFEGEQLTLVRNTLNNLTPEQIVIAKYWDEGPPTNQWTPIIDILINNYGISAPRAARILSITHAAINDTFAVTWYYKYLWNIARPFQLDQSLKPIVSSPKHPSYPAGHATVAGCAQTVLSYFFEAEQQRLKDLAEECAISRVWSGVHYLADCSEGLKLGRQIGQVVIASVNSEQDKNGLQIDVPIIQKRSVQLPPPPYTQ